MNKYIMYESVIERITERSLSVETKDHGQQVVHTGEVVILENDQYTKIENSSLIVGDKIWIYLSDRTPMTMSLPPQFSPYLIVVDRSIDSNFHKLDFFNQDLVSEDMMLKINPDAIEVVIQDGEVVSEYDLANKHLLVFYTVSTRSILAQTNPKAVVILPDLV